MTHSVTYMSSMLRMGLNLLAGWRLTKNTLRKVGIKTETKKSLLYFINILEKGRGAYLEFITVMSSNKTNKPENDFLLKRNSEATINAVEKDKDGKIIVKMEVV